MDSKHEIPEDLKRRYATACAGNALFDRAEREFIERIAAAESQLTEARSRHEELVKTLYEPQLRQALEERDEARSQIEALRTLLNLNESGVSAVMAAIEGKRKAEAQLASVGKALAQIRPEDCSNDALVWIAQAKQV